MRTRSAVALRDHVHQVAGAMPCVVTGDFNSNAGSTAYRALLAEQQPATASLHDVFRDAHAVPTGEEGTFHFFTGRRGGWRIDWILASTHYQTLSAEIDHTRGPHGYPSDHFLVTAVLRARAAQ